MPGRASPALLIVDVQEAMDDPKWGRRNNPELLPNLQRVLGRWRSAGAAVFLIADDEPNPESPYHPGRPGNDFKPEVAPLAGERVVRKTSGDAFEGTDLEAMLRADGIDALVIGGFMTNMCVAATVTSASRRGFRVRVLSDATATVGESDLAGRWTEAQEVHRRALEALRDESVQVIETAEAIRLVQQPS